MACSSVKLIAIVIASYKATGQSERVKPKNPALTISTEEGAPMGCTLPVSSMPIFSGYTIITTEAEK
jgi:hypothetical protein